MDGFRGIASIMVVCFHCGFLPFGHWGVTLFFVISGYCILASADSCQKQNLGAWGFAVRRFRRIYPPYFLAVVFFLITRLLKIWLSHENQVARFTPLQFVQNVTLTQWLTLLAHPNSSGANPSLMVSAFWSLNYEVQFYAVVGIFPLLAMRAGRLLLIMLRGASEWITGTIPGRAISFLGLISYSLYLIHQFNLKLARTVIGHILPQWTPALAVGAGIIAFHVALATVIWFFCERPFLNERISLAGLFKSSRRSALRCLPAKLVQRQ